MREQTSSKRRKHEYKLRIDERINIQSDAKGCRFLLNSNFSYRYRCCLLDG